MNPDQKTLQVAVSMSAASVAQDKWVAQISLVRYGLTLILLRILLALLLPFLLVLAVVWLDAPNQLLEGMVALARLGTSLLGIVGVAFCLAAPRQSGGRPWLLGSLGLELLGIASRCLSVMIAFDWLTPDAVELAAVLVTAATIGELISFALFIGFLRKLSIYFDHPDGADAAVRLWLELAGVLLCLVFVTIGWMPLLSGIAAFVIGLMCLFAYIDLVGDVKQAVERRLDRLAGAAGSS
jgi:hypothetical protein